MKKFFSRENIFSILLSLVLSMALVSAVAYATTVGSNVTTGDITASGAVLVSGQFQASSTALFGTTVTFGGNIAVGGRATTTASTGDFKTQGQIHASSTVLFTSGLTAYGDINVYGKATTTFSTGDFRTQGEIWASSTATFGGDVAVSGRATTTASTGDFKTQGQVQASSTVLLGGPVITYGNLTVDKAATTTVTFNQAGINFDSNTLVVDPNSNKVGVGSSSPLYALGVTGTTTSTGGMQIGHQGSGISALRFGTCTFNPGTAIVASTTISFNCTGASGVVASDKVFVIPSGLPQQLILTSASSTAAEVIQVAVLNTGITSSAIATTSTTGILAPSATWSWIAIR